MIFKNRSFYILILYFLGIIHWYFFINLGKPTFETFDWMIHTYPVHDLVKLAVNELTIPYHAAMYNLPIIENVNSIYESTNGPWIIRWFAHGLPIVSPHLFFLSFFNIPLMMTFNLLFHFSIGFLGVVLWIRKLKLSIAASIFLILIWNLNGYLVSRMSVGHLASSSAYFYIPLFFLFIYRFIETENLNWKENIKNILLFSLFIFFTKLNANGHSVYQFFFSRLLDNYILSETVGSFYFFNIIVIFINEFLHFSDIFF